MFSWSVERQISGSRWCGGMRPASMFRPGDVSSCSQCFHPASIPVNYEGGHAWLHQRPVYAVSPQDACGPVGLSRSWRLTHRSRGGFFLTSFTVALTDGQMWHNLSNAWDRVILMNWQTCLTMQRGQKKNSEDINIAVTFDFSRDLCDSQLDGFTLEYTDPLSHHWCNVLIFARFSVVNVTGIYCIQKQCMGHSVTMQPTDNTLKSEFTCSWNDLQC